MNFRIVERDIGRAGSLANRQRRGLEWDKRYGLGRWATGYDPDGRFIPYEEAVEALYNRSYEMHFDAHPKDLAELVATASFLYNSHAKRTGSIDLQVPAVEKCLERRGLRLSGKEPVDIGSADYDAIGNRLSPARVMFLGGINGQTLEGFWQSDAKCLAIRED